MIKHMIIKLIFIITNKELTFIKYLNTQFLHSQHFLYR